jgi:hypothetical protein
MFFSKGPLANAPDADKDAGLFKVPRVITHGG